MNRNKMWIALFELISSADENQSKILAILSSCTNKRNLKKIVNAPCNQPSGDETMLMWAIWRLKKDVVSALLDAGANPHYVNMVGESVVTYWPFSASSDNAVEKQKVAVEIVNVLNSCGVDFSKGSYLSYSLVKRAKEFGLDIISERLKELGY